MQGAVQGVGFRPFVYRLATELGLAGAVINSSAGVEIEVEGEDSLLESFVARLEREKPPRALISKIECSRVEPSNGSGFRIGPSDRAGSKSAAILPDIGTCEECLKEIFDPANRRYLYPFTNCTNCGPRFSIVESLPYDRANTSMRGFRMCAECEAEYRDVQSRRFHAQPNACPNCGPHLELWTPSGEVLSKSETALSQAAQAIRAGLVLALKGVGGFQLMVDARNPQAVLALRQRKRRPDKALAVLFPSISVVEESCKVSELERDLLCSPEAPIVILDRTGNSVADSVAPGNPRLGAMLPYSPLHHLLMNELGFPVVATSGNLSDEPICIHEREALQRLNGIADIFLVHDRPIVRHVDDSIVQVVLEREMILRRARGYAPLPISLPVTGEPVLAVGAHLKNTVALGVAKNIFISQHIGNLETAEAFSAFRKAAVDLPALYETRPARVACDLHPSYGSTQFARESGLEVVPVQHHYAHILSCMAEHQIDEPVLGVAWDGTGLGPDATIWGGEFLLVTGSGFERVAHLRQFRLPGGDACARDGRRSALGILHEICGQNIPDNRALKTLSAEELRLLRRVLEKQVNAPITSSAGRLFDAVAALVGLRERSSFEGQAAMELEFAVSPSVNEAYPFELHGTEPIVLDWEPALREILMDVQAGESAGTMAAKFHNGLSEAIAAIAKEVGLKKMVLSGGCFQNKYLLEQAVHRLRADGLEVFWHRRVPPNDGGIALGQVIAARRSYSGKGQETQCDESTRDTVGRHRNLVSKP